MEALLSWPGAIIVASICLVILAAIFLGRSIVVDRSGISVYKHKQKKQPPHANCPHRTSAVNAVRKTAEFIEKRMLIKESTLKEQMEVYDEILEEVRSIFKKIFSDLIREKLGDSDSYSTNEDYVAFDNMIIVVFGELNEIVRRWFKNNHYALRTPEEQVEYIRRKKEVIIQLVSENINRRWNGRTVSRSELEEALCNQSGGEWEEYIEDTFNRVFNISRVKQNLRLELEERYYNYIKDNFGDDTRIDESVKEFS